VLGLADRGRLEAGARSDLLVLGADARPTRVMRRGRWLGTGLI
jgi:N-acetylglucosamine-6-phosphate deacetylase